MKKMAGHGNQTSLQRNVHALVAPVVANAGFDLVELRLLRGPKGATRLQLFIDRPTGVLVDDCAAISRKVGAMLEIEDPIKGAYDLEVSSPGMKRLIRHAADVERFAGVRARVTLTETGDSPRITHIGSLVSADDETVTVELDSGEQVTAAWSATYRVSLDPTVDQWLELGEQQRRAAEAVASNTSEEQQTTED